MTEFTPIEFSQILDKTVQDACAKYASVISLDDLKEAMIKAYQIGFSHGAEENQNRQYDV